MAFTTDITQLEAQYATGNTVTSTPVNPPHSTWIIDFDDQKRCVYYSTDGMEALKQSIHIVLSVERLEHVMYSPDYGQEFNAYLASQSEDYVVAIWPTLIKNTLLVDDRITNCAVTNVVREHGVLSCDINLNTIFGDVTVKDFGIGV